MFFYFAVFCALVICAGGFVVRIYEWRQAVLCGPHIGRDPSHRNSKS